jgi:TusA-related sulfurtransferase
MDENRDYIDCFGDMCPLPILKIEKRLGEIEPGDEFLLVTDHSCTVESIKQKYSKRNVQFRIEEVLNGVWEVYMKKL